MLLIFLENDVCVEVAWWRPSLYVVNETSEIGLCQFEW